MHGELTEQEQGELQDVILATGGPGAASFSLAGGYEVHPRGEPGVDLAQPVRDWLAAHSFTRHVDVRRGPFYRRPA